MYASQLALIYAKLGNKYFTTPLSNASVKNPQPEPEHSCGRVPESAAGSEPAAPLEQCNHQS